MPFYSGPNVGDGEIARRMDYGADARLLIVNCDDLGSSRSANVAIERALRHGIAGSASLMTPCPWAAPAAEACFDLDVGVHLTLTSEYPAYRWRSLTGRRTLHDQDGYLPRTTHEVWANADLEDIEEECVAQIDLALAWGMDVSHLNSHMDVLQLDRRHFDMLMRLGARYRLPIRFCRRSFEWPFARISRSAVSQAGLVTADAFLTPPWGEPVGPLLMERIPNLSRGITEVVAHPADDGEELRAYDTEYADMRAADAECLADPALCDFVRASGVTTIGFKPVRDAMRNSPLSRLH